MAIVYLTVDQVLALHARALEADGGLPGVRSMHGLASAVGQPEQDVFGQELYPTLAEKAAAYAFYLAENHPFNDANKRTTLATLEVFLETNGYELTATDDDAFATMLELASGNMTREALTDWVSRNMKPSSHTNVLGFILSN